MSLIRLHIEGISYSQTQNGAYALILFEEDSDRKLPIIIGAFEAQAIAIALEEDIKTPRPLTHDLLKNIADAYNLTIKQVIIHKLIDGVFYSSLIMECDGVEEVIDARTSDAIALALRFKTPIFTYKNILDKAGIYLKMEHDSEAEEDDKQLDHLILDEIFAEELEKETSSNESYSKFALSELYSLLDEAVANEDYEKAARIRDEISKR